MITPRRRAGLCRLCAHAGRDRVGDRGARPHTQGPADHRASAPAATATRASAPEMGAAAVRLADRVIVTDDNPRSEDPARDPRARSWRRRRARREVAGRREAIRLAIAEAGAGDIVLLAGKGHEQGQIVGDKVLPFDDVDGGAGGSGMSPLWTACRDRRGDRRHRARRLRRRRRDLRLPRGRPGRPVHRAEGRGDRRPSLRRAGLRRGRGRGAGQRAESTRPHVHVADTTLALNALGLGVARPLPAAR